jgi:hypothetical protein
LTSDQAHYAIAGQVVEGGQLIAFFNPATYNSNPEINVQGGAINIPSGSTVTNISNNTNYGTVTIGSPVTNTFFIQNILPGTLAVSSISITGANASEFTFTGISTPTNLVPGNLVFPLTFSPTAAGTRSAMITINSNDFDEPVYTFIVAGTSSAAIATGISNNDQEKTFFNIYPNPAKDEAVIRLNISAPELVQISVYNVEGKLVMNNEKQMDKGEQLFTLKTSPLSNGEYFVKVQTRTNTSTAKLIINH